MVFEASALRVPVHLHHEQRWIIIQNIFVCVHLRKKKALCTQSRMVIELQTIHELILHVINVISGLNGNARWVQEG